MDEAANIGVREREILTAIVETYIATGEPVGSRTLARSSRESLSPATGARFSLLPPDNATGNFTKIVQRVPVRIVVPADGPLAPLLRPGLSVTVTINTKGFIAGRPVVAATPQAGIAQNGPVQREQ